MPLQLYMDVHVPIVVTEALRLRGHDVLTAQADGASRSDDDELLARAKHLGRVLFSQDQDFLRIATEWQQEGKSFPGIIYAAQRGASLGGLADDLDLLLSCAFPEELRDRVVYLPLR